MIHPIFYGWFDSRAKTFHVSRYPPDAPVRPSIELNTKAEVLALVDRKKGLIMWFPPLPERTRATTQ